MHGTISGPSKLTLGVPYSGTVLTIDGANTYGGGTEIVGFPIFSPSTGVVAVSGSSPLGSGPVMIGAAAPNPGTEVRGILSGTGTIADVTSYGRLSPGNGTAHPGTLSTASLTLADGSSLAALLTSASSYSTVDAAGPVSFSGASLDVTLGYVPAPGDTFTLVRNNSVTAVMGQFKGLAEGQQFAAGGWLFSITYQGNGGNDVVITAISPVPPVPPVPATGSADAPVLLAGAGLVLGGLILLYFAIRLGVTRRCAATPGSPPARGRTARRPR